MSQLIPVILSGGAGTRLWPASRQSHPKPFVELPDGDTLIGKTLGRALLLGDGEVITVTGKDHFLMTRDRYRRHPQIATGRMHYILEPLGRNTAPAATVAGLYAQRHWGDEAVLLIMPADHIITDLEAFRQAVRQATTLAERGYLATFGIQPEHPETGYGYIRCGEALDDAGYAVDRFVEKPDAATARSYLDSGAYLWNSGIFCFPVGGLVKQLAVHAPDILEGVRSCLGDDVVSPLELPEAQFSRLPGNSIDYALMEKTERAAVVPCSIGWNDVGSWQAFSELAPSDAQGNRLLGDALAVASRGCFIRAGSRLVAAVGVEDLAIVDSGDALLIADLERSQQVKEVVAALENRNHPAAARHPVEMHPWGRSELVEATAQTRIRRLHVPAGNTVTRPEPAQHRCWTVISGAVEVRGTRLRSGSQLAATQGEAYALQAVEDSVLIEVELVPVLDSQDRSG